MQTKMSKNEAIRKLHSEKVQTILHLIRVLDIKVSTRDMNASSTDLHYGHIGDLAEVESGLRKIIEQLA